MLLRLFFVAKFIAELLVVLFKLASQIALRTHKIFWPQIQAMPFEYVAKGIILSNQRYRAMIIFCIIYSFVIQSALFLNLEKCRVRELTNVKGVGGFIIFTLAISIPSAMVFAKPMNRLLFL